MEEERVGEGWRSRKMILGEELKKNGKRRSCRWRRKRKGRKRSWIMRSQWENEEDNRRNQEDEEESDGRC